MIKKIIICFFLLSFLGCVLDTKHRIAVGPNNRKQVVHDVNQNKYEGDVPVNPTEKPLLTDVSQDDFTAPDDSDKELSKAIIDKLKEVLGNQWPVHREAVKFWLLISVLVFGCFILMIHWLIRAINRWLSPDLELGMSFVVVLFVLIFVLLIVGI